MINTSTFITSHPTVADQQAWYSVDFPYDKDPSTGAPELTVTLDGSPLTWSVDYIVGVQGIQLTTAPTADLELVIRRNIPLTQEQDYQTGLISAEQIEHGFDRSVMRDQMLADFATWLEDQMNDLSSVAWSGSYNDLSDTPTIPTKTSELTNDSGFVSGISLAPVATSGAYNDLTGKPTLGTAAAAATTDFATAAQGAKADTAVQQGALATVATSGNYSDLSGKPSLAAVATSGNYSDLSGKPSLATVATSGNYNDLSNKPTIPDTTNMQVTTNLVTSVSAASTDLQYPSAKLFYDTCGDIETLINAL